MTGNLNLNENKITNLAEPTQDKDSTNKEYVDKLIHNNANQPSHNKDEFSYLMSSASRWTGEANGGNSFVLKK